jgi:hypothetical protein
MNSMADDSYDPYMRLDGVHVLVVDDNVDARTIYKQILGYAGASVLVTGSAAGAVRALQHLRPDVVISDLSMPRKDGLWLVRWIRRRDARRGGHLPVIAVTARDDLYLSTTAEHEGFDAYLTKPVPPREFFRTIASLARPAPVDAPQPARA